MNWSSLCFGAVATLLITVHSASVASAQAGFSEGTLRYVREANAPSIGQRIFTFDYNGWISCINTLERHENFESCNLLPQASPGPVESLDFLADQIRQGGQYRNQVAAILAGGRYSIEGLDEKLASGSLAWQQAGWANILQVRMAPSHVFYIAFYEEHLGTKNVPVDGALVPDPSFVVPEPKMQFVTSPQALAFRQEGDYARCGQQALLDAGYDPSGVDGAPGGGARRALAAWAEANGLTMPNFTTETASQVCFVLTAPEAYHADMPVGTMVGYPGAAWNGWTNKEGGVHDFQGIDVKVRLDGDAQRQIDSLNFGPGITYRFEGQDSNGQPVNAELTAPWPISGTVMTHGTDEPRPQVLFELLRDDTIGAAKAVIDGQAGGYNGLVDDLFNRPEEIDGRWTVIGRLDGADVVVADLVPSRSPTGNRVVIIFSDTGSGGQLLYSWHNRIIPGENEIRR